MKWIMGFGVLLLAAQAHAFPEMVRHGYVNCTACHVSPTGGGSLTPYGRAMSKELLSAWGTERETGFLNGVFASQPDWLLTGGDVRGIQVHAESPSRLSEKWFLMQAALELGIRFKNWTAMISLGEAIPSTKELRAVSTRYYLMWNPVEELALRAGRFIPVFGLNIPYHTLPTRQSLGFGPGRDRDSIEGFWSGEDWNFAVSASRTPVGPIAASARESLLTVQFQRSIQSASKVGMSWLAGESETVKRTALGVHGVFGFSKRWVYMSEFDFQRTSPVVGTAATGLFHFSQLIFEPVRGWQIYLLEDYEKADLENSSTLVNSFGPGMRFFPRPHFELDLVFLKRRVAAVADRYDDFAWILVHYYF